MAQENQDSLNVLKRMRENVNWEMEDERREFYRQVYPMICNWQGQLPNLRDIFRTDEIDWLLVESVESYGRNPERFVDFVINTGYKDAYGKHLLRRTTPIHRAAKRWFFNRDIVVGKLFRIYDSFDVNYVDEDGSTHFHIACEQHDCLDVVKKFLDVGQDPNCIVPETGDSLLHLALKTNKKEVAKLLSRHGANLLLANKNGWTPLHIISMVDPDGSSTETFFEICSDSRQTLEIDARDNEGNTPLNLALRNNSKKAVEILLRNGANPNLVNEKGETPLHMIDEWGGEDVVRSFLDTTDALNFPVQIDARNNKGNTPLHSAIRNRYEGMIELLLKRGADPNAVNQEGSTPLHLICTMLVSKKGPIMLRKFFKTCDEIQRTVQVDVRDNLGQTPLQLAVTAVSLDAVDILLDRGADLSEFSFPTESLFKHVYDRGYDPSKLQLASLPLAVVERLEKNGYELNRSEALTIVKFFAKHEVFEKSADLDKFWYDDEKFTEKAKKIRIIKPDLSLYDLTRLSTEEMKKLLAKTEYITFACSQKLNRLLKRHRSPCDLHLCEKISRRFFRRWALDSFLELTGYKLPILCSEMIIERLKNEDLCNICLSVSVSF